MPVDSNTFYAAFRKLVTLDVASQLPGAYSGAEAVSEAEIKTLLGYGSLLSMSSTDGDRNLAYEVGTRLVEVAGDHPDLSIVSAVDVILSRLGNFPGRSFLRKHYRHGDQRSDPINPRLKLERIAREVENTVSRDGEREVTLTDFQFDLFSRIDKFSSVSVSAPTSAGKSFVMGLDLVRRLSREQAEFIVYIVPTRALIREISMSLRKHLLDAGLSHVPVRVVPFPIEREKAVDGAVFVFTQERLVSFLNSTEVEPYVTTLIVDEAQCIQDDARGIVLQSAIELVLEKFPDAEIHFASPLAKNPEYLLSKFGLLGRGDFFTEQISPVSQNIILVSEVKSKPSQAAFSLLLGEEVFDLGRRDLGFRFRNIIQPRAALARAITREDESTIIYANDASTTEDLAKALIVGQEPTASDKPEIAELIEFIRTEVHPEYPLIEVLPHRVAFHYGAMPSIVRAKVEDLFKGGILRFVCCTSTLLQGVNLPARHIVIENPRRGNGKPMNRRDFLNLAGRAGRLLFEFHGNIWCLRPSSWDLKVYEGERLQPIVSAMDEVMEDGGKAIQRLLSSEATEDEIDLAEAALGKVFCEYVVGEKNLFEAEFSSPENRLELENTLRRCKELGITLPRDILNINRTVRPDRLQGLYNFLSAQQSLAAFVPIKPGQPNANKRMGEIIRIIQEHLDGQNPEENQSHVFFRWLATEWIYNMPLGRIISERVEFLKRRGSSDSLSSMIRGVLQALEQGVRFRLVKHYMAYVSILALVFRERDRADLAEGLEPFHVYLECGASDRVALNLIALGLSRNTALALHDKLSLPPESSPEDCFSKLAATPLAELRIPRLCLLELEELLGRQPVQ